MELLERDSYLGDLGRLLDQTATRQGCLLFLGGEAGVGKTVLVRQFVQLLQSGTEILSGACDPLSTPRPLGPLLDIAAARGGDLARLLEGVEQRDKVFRTFLAELVASPQPTLVVFEDVHWADDATLDLLRFLGRRIGAARALLIATYRDDEVGPRHPLRIVLGDLATAPAVRRLTLPPLSEQAVRVLATSSDLDPAELYRQTAGNPFFVTEVLASGASGIPPTVRDAVLARAARLSSAGQVTIAAAAVIGPRIEHWLLAEVVGADAAALDECIAAGVLHQQAGALAFRHELARAAILDTLTPQRRLELHRATLAALSVAPAGAGDPARLADHAEAAGNQLAVLDYAPAAARRASRLRAHREAAAQYARALRFAATLAPTDRAPLLEAFANECSHIDDLESAIAARREALAIWRAAGDRPNEGQTLSQLALDLVNAGHNAEAEQASRAAIEILEALAPAPELVQAYRVQAALRMLNRDNHEAIAWGEKTIELAERFGSPLDLAGAHNVVGTALLFLGDKRGRAHMEQSIRLAREAGLDSIAATAIGNLASAAGELYQFALADHYLEEGIALSAELDLDRQRLYLLAWQALVRVYQGRWNEAAELASTVLRRPVMAISRIMALVALGRLRARRGDPEIWKVLDEALELAEQTATLQRLAPVRAARAEAAWLEGDMQRARAEADAALELAVRQQHGWFTSELSFWIWRAYLSAHPLSTSPTAWAHASGLPLSHAGERGLGGEGTTPFAQQIAGDWEAAAARWQELGCPYEAAQALAYSDDEAALRCALAEFERLGARPAATLAARRLRELGVRGVPRGPRPATRANPANLTLREVEIVGLLAEGLRNAEIAVRLHLSAKTVDHHVSAVLGKLGVRTRTEAAREAARLGLLGQDGESETPK
jgi:predicted ATPase/DNA-binding CsgD family transcriptional regulator